MKHGSAEVFVLGRDRKKFYRADVLERMFTRRQLKRIFDRIMPESHGYPNYGWDMPTLRMVYPEKVSWLRDINEAYKRRYQSARMTENETH